MKIKYTNGNYKCPLCDQVFTIHLNGKVFLKNKISGYRFKHIHIDENSKEFYPMLDLVGYNYEYENKMSSMEIGTREGFVGTLFGTPIREKDKEKLSPEVYNKFYNKRS